MANCTAYKVACSCLPSPVDDPTKSNKREWQIRSSDCYQTKQRDLGSWVSPRPDIDRNEPKRRGEKRESEERGYDCEKDSRGEEEPEIGRGAVGKG